jgi:hypothetical protein
VRLFELAIDEARGVLEFDVFEGGPLARAALLEERGDARPLARGVRAVGLGARADRARGGRIRPPIAPLRAGSRNGARV